MRAPLPVCRTPPRGAGLLGGRLPASMTGSRCLHPASAWLAMFSITAVAMMGGACGAIPFDLHRVYKPPQFESLQTVATVAIVPLTDKRGVEPTRISIDMGPGNNFS